MIQFEDALRKILRSARRLNAQKLPLEAAINCVLAEDIKAALDMPPFDKSAMDGYAVRSSDTRVVPAQLKCIGTITPGKSFKKTVAGGLCAKIMTGAAIPSGADAVVMVEYTSEDASSGQVKILKGVKKWENVCFRGEDIKKGRIVLKKGALLRAPEIAIAASLGRARVRVYRRPKVAILNTGDEIVEPPRRRPPGKIYNSNGPMLRAHLAAMNILPRYLGIAADEKARLSAMIKKGLDCDILLLSGGVSMGDCDFVPKVLKSSGVREVFHNVKIKPGKPLFFGTRGKKLIFGIPGNPVSTYLAFLAFIKPAIDIMMGKTPELRFRTGILKDDFRQKPGRKHFVPARVFEEKGTLLVSPVAGYSGSADIASVSKACAFMVVDGSVSSLRRGDAVEVLFW